MSDQVTIPAPPPVARKSFFRRIYPSTWLAMLLAAGMMFLVEFPGHRGFNSPRGRSVYEHGWPLAWMEGYDIDESDTRWRPRGSVANENGPIVETLIDEREEARNPWSLHDEMRPFDSLRLAGDIACAFVAIALTSAVFQFWRRRHGSLLRFRLRTLLGFVALIALLLAPVASWHRELQKEHDIVAGLKNECASGLVVHETEGLYGVQEKQEFAGVAVGSIWSPPEWLPDSVAKVSGLRRLFDRVNWLGIHGDRFSDRTLAPLADLSQLESLWIGKGDLTPAGFQALLRLTNLRTLRLPEATITDEQLAQLCQLTRLEFLDLGKTEVSDDGIAAISRLHNLGTLRITSHRISGKGFESLKSLRPLTGLFVEADGLTDEGIASIQQLQSLEGMELRKTHLTTLRLEQLPRLLDLAFVENMDLGTVELDRLPPLQGLTISSVSSSGRVAHPRVRLGDVKLMEGLLIDGAILDESDLDRIADAPRLWKLDLRHIQLAGASGLRLGTNARVIHLDVSDSDFADIHVDGDEFLRTIRLSSNPSLATIRLIDLPRLESFELADNPRLVLAQGLLSDLSSLPRLSKLTLNIPQLCDKDLAGFKPSETLESLNLSGCNLTGKGLVYLRELMPTCYVDFTHTPVSDEAVAALQKALPGLSVNFEPKKPVVQDLRQQVALVRNRLAKNIECKMNPFKLADDDFACLVGLENLDTLDLSDTHLTDAGLDHLRRLPKLRELIVQRTQLTDAAVRSLKQMPALVHVDIDGTRITAEGRRALGKLARGENAERN